MKFNIVIFLLIILTVSCRSMPKGDSWFSEEDRIMDSWQLVFMPSEGNSIPVVLGGSHLENSQLHGIAYVQDDGSYIIYIDRLDWFNTWHDGYTKATFSMIGTLKFIQNGGIGFLSVVDNLSIEHVTEGKLNYRGVNLYGDQAVDQIQRRWDRIFTTVQFLDERLNSESFDQRKLLKNRQKGEITSFEDAMVRVLFPEVFEYIDSNEMGSTNYIRGEGIFWDIDYSDNNIPDNLREIRNSGTLYRDYEESPEMFYLAYIWNSLWHSKIPEVSFEYKEN